MTTSSVVAKVRWRRKVRRCATAAPGSVVSATGILRLQEDRLAETHERLRYWSAAGSTVPRRCIHSAMHHHSMAQAAPAAQPATTRSEEHTSELQSLMRNSYAVFCLKKKNETNIYQTIPYCKHS